jgi:GAF domain
VGRSLAEMAQRDLDAALQLLADRAQFITGATGAAIALRRSGLNDMLCRASTGANAPELGALLSTEFGLSGESVRTKQLLRCDDAERDERVNREVCRHLGIASVVVMPVVHDDEVLGVFELFSGKTNAFGERDLSAMQRLGEMVETAVRLAQLTVALPESLKAHESSIADATTAAPEEQVEDEILDIAAPDSNLAVSTLPGDSKREEGDLLETDPEIVGFEPPTVVADGAMAGFSVAGRVASVEASAENTDFSQKPDSADGKKPLLWSVPESAGDLETPQDSDQSHVPPVLRGLRKCEVCGFPISGGRVLCVECEEKRWRGQLKRTQPMPTGAIPHTVTAKKEGRSFAAAPANAKPVPASSAMSVPEGNPTIAAANIKQVTESSREASPVLLDRKDGTVTEVTSSPIAAESVSSSFVLSSGLDDSPSWISAHKYVIGVMFLVALLAAFFLLR